MWGVNNNYSNSFIWLILLILIFFNSSSSNNAISDYNYFKLTNSSGNTKNLIANNLIF